MAPILVQSASTFTGATTSTLTVSMGANFTSGNCIVVLAGLLSGTSNIFVSGITVGGSADHFFGVGAVGNSFTGFGDAETMGRPELRRRVEQRGDHHHQHAV